MTNKQKPSEIKQTKIQNPVFSISQEHYDFLKDRFTKRWDKIGNKLYVRKRKKGGNYIGEFAVDAVWEYFWNEIVPDLIKSNKQHDKPDK